MRFVIAIGLVLALAVSAQAGYSLKNQAVADDVAIQKRAQPTLTTIRSDLDVLKVEVTNSISACQAIDPSAFMGAQKTQIQAIRSELVNAAQQRRKLTAQVRKLTQQMQRMANDKAAIAESDVVE